MVGQFTRIGSQRNARSERYLGGLFPTTIIPCLSADHPPSASLLLPPGSEKFRGSTFWFHVLHTPSAHPNQPEPAPRLTLFIIRLLLLHYVRITCRAQALHSPLLNANTQRGSLTRPSSALRKLSQRDRNSPPWHLRAKVPQDPLIR